MMNIPSKHNGFDIQILPVKPEWACARYATHRCVIGTWNFDETHFIEYATGHGKSEMESYQSAMRVFNLEDEVMNEDDLMLGNY